MDFRGSLGVFFLGVQNFGASFLFFVFRSIADDCAQIAVSGLKPPFESPYLDFPENGQINQKLFKSAKTSTLMRGLVGGWPGRLGGPWLDSQVTTLSSKDSWARKENKLKRFGAYKMAFSMNLFKLQA